MRKSVVLLMILTVTAFGAVAPGMSYGEEPAPGSGTRPLFEWDQWPKKPAPAEPAGDVKGKGSTGADTDAEAGAEVGSKAGQDASAGILSGTTAKIVLIGAIVVGGAIALGSGGGGTSSGH